MSSDATVPQGGQEQLRSQQMSLQRGYPPAQVPGYELERLLGVGAYGEVWVAVERNTGRRVAIKFYAHRGGLDWSLLSREVEKLAFLFADRYVVQLIGVGWDAEPPYYVMEYLERGSLAERLQQGPIPVAEAIEVFHDVAVGLAHAHGKGVLHCDLKPANILLDQDNRPRLADFGQSRLSHEQVPALGTLFYMAPEQADLEALPDARWDVYALGALLYCMLTGQPPHRVGQAAEQLEQSEDLGQRLAHYRRLIRKSPPSTAHRQVPGVDHALAEIIDGCLAADPQKRYPNVQAVLDALRVRAIRRARRPMMVLGAVGPVLLLLVVSMFAWWGFGEVLRRSDEALTRRALESNRFAAQYVARAAANELDSRWRSVEQLAWSVGLEQILTEIVDDTEIRDLLVRLSDPQAEPAELEALQRRFRDHPKRERFQQGFAALIAARRRPEVSGWFLNDARGIQLARVPEKPEIPTIGKNFSWRSYFHGQPKDMPAAWRPGPDQHILDTTLSPVYRSQGTNTWMVAVSTPIFRGDARGEFLGVMGLVIEVGRFAELQGSEQQFAVLVDWREGENKGAVLQHPLLNKFLAERGTIPDRFKNYRVTHAQLPASPARMQHYSDPLAADPEAEQYRTQWLAQMEPVTVRGQDTGWIVIVQEAYQSAIGAPLDRLKWGLVRYGLAAVGMIVLVIVGLWGFTIRLLDEAVPPRRFAAAEALSESGSGGATPEGPTPPSVG